MTLDNAFASFGADKSAEATHHKFVEDYLAKPKDSPKIQHANDRPVLEKAHDSIFDVIQKLPPELKLKVMAEVFKASADVINRIDKSRPADQQIPELKSTGDVAQDWENMADAVRKLQLSPAEREELLITLYKTTARVLNDWNQKNGEEDL